MAKSTTPPEVVEFFRAASAKRERAEGACARCGKRFEGITKRRFCSDVCRALASRERARAEQRP